MRLYPGKIGLIAEEVTQSLVSAGDIEVVDANEVRLDMEAVLKEYLRLDRDASDEAKHRMESRGLGYEKLGKVKSQVLKEKGAPQQDDVLPYLLTQMLNMLFHSQNVEEIYAEDTDLRTKMTPILRKHMDVESDLDREVRSRIKNLEEGTSNFEVEYAKMMDQMKRKRGLE